MDMRRIAPLLLAASLLLAACARMETPPPSAAEPPPAQWDLADNAEAVYQYLAFQDARRDGDVKRAEKALDILLRLEPDPELFFEAAEFYWHRSIPDRTRQVLKKGLELFPDNVNLVLFLSSTYLTDKRQEDALTTLRSFLTNHPGDPAAIQELARILIQQQRQAEALDMLKRIPQKDRIPVIRYYMAKAYAGLGSIEQATEELKLAVADNPDFVEAWAELAYLYELNKDYASAEETYTRILEMGETSQEVWLRLINLNLKLNDPDKALDLAKQGPSELSFQLSAATEFMDEGFYDHAGRILDPLAEDAPEEPAIYFYLALLAYDGRNDPQTALDMLARVPTDNQYHERSLRFRCHLLHELGRTEEALALAVEGKGRFPDDLEFWTLEGRLLEALGRTAEALDVLGKAQANWPEDPDVLYARGMILEKHGRRAEALADMERIITLDPEHADALNYVGYTLAEEGRDLDRAQVLVRTALNLRPDNGYIMDSLAWVHFMRGELRKAWAEIQRAMEKVGSDPIMWEHYGDIAASLGYKDKARKAYRKALELGTAKEKEIRGKLDSL